MNRSLPHCGHSDEMNWCHSCLKQKIRAARSGLCGCSEILGPHEHPFEPEPEPLPPLDMKDETDA